MVEKEHLLTELNDDQPNIYWGDIFLSKCIYLRRGRFFKFRYLQSGNFHGNA